MLTRLRNRTTQSEGQGGFTLIELLVVVIIIGILLAIAVPSYLKFRDRAAENAAKANVRASIPAIEAYYADNGTYATMTVANLKADYDAGFVGTLGTVTASAYCVSSTVNGKTFRMEGPGGTVTAGACP